MVSILAFFSNDPIRVRILLTTSIFSVRKDENKLKRAPSFKKTIEELDLVVVVETECPELDGAALLHLEADERGVGQDIAGGVPELL